MNEASRLAETTPRTTFNEVILLFLANRLKCIRNEIFDNDFIGPFESAFKDKTIAVYRLLISGLDPKL